MEVTAHEACAICHAPTALALDCGLLPLANGYAEPDRREPLTVRYCGACGLYQLGYLVPPDALFGDYTYRTGATRQSRVWQHLAGDVWRTFGATTPAHALVVDVGGNDGSALAAFAHSSTRCVNIDPYAPEQVGAFVQLVREPWTPATARAVVERHGHADILLASNVWAHMSDLHASATAAATLLSVDGWLVVQAPWARDLFRYSAYDTLYHEHVYYLGVRAMRALFQRHGMDVHKVDYLPDVHGGSLRYWIRHGNDGITDSVQRFADIEADAAEPGGYSFQHAYEAWQIEQQMLWQRVPRPLCAVTAPAKATMFFAMTDTAQFVDRLFDDTTAKQGKRLPGTSLVVEPLTELPRDANAVLMAWNHAAALRARLRALRHEGRVLTPQSMWGDCA